MISIRGATTIESNDKQNIWKCTTELLEELIRRNHLDMNKIFTVLFSCTRDITAAYPAPAARALGLTNASLMCLQEMYVEDSMEKCIRVCIFYDGEIEQALIKNVYLNDAIHLRPDWSFEG